MQELQEMPVWSLVQEDLLEAGMATHSNILAWRIPWTEKPGGLQSTGLQRVRHDWSDLARTHSFFVQVLCTRRCSECMTPINFFDLILSSQQPCKEVFLSSLFYKWRNWAQETIYFFILTVLSLQQHEGFLELWCLGSRARKLTSCSKWVELHLSSPTRGWTHILCTERRILNHWTTRKVPSPGDFK